MTVYAESSAVLAWLLGEDPGDAVRGVLVDADAVITSDSDARGVRPRAHPRDGAW